MKEQLSNVAYGSLARYDSAQALKMASKDPKLTHAQYAAVEHEFEKATRLTVGTRPVIDVISEYEKGDEGRIDETFKGADRNLKRFLPSNEDYVELIQTLAKNGVVLGRG